MSPVQGAHYTKLFNFMFLYSVVFACLLLVLQKKLSSPQEAADEVFTKEEGESISNDAEEPALYYSLMSKSPRSLLPGNKSKQHDS